MAADILILICSLTLLYFGAEFALDGAEKIGKKIGLSPLLIGMFLVGVGTSLPELFVGHIASLKGQSEMALGTLVGSNIANIYLILGVCGILTPMSLSGKDMKPQLWFHLALLFVMGPLILLNQINWIAGILLLAYIAAYLVFTYLEMKNNSGIHKEEVHDNMWIVGAKMLIGFSLLYFGGDLLVDSASSLCLRWGISEYVISAIFVAFGTSFPELVTSLIAIRKKKDTDLIVGNILGSNIFNCGLILGSISFYGMNITSPKLMEMIVLGFCSLYFLFLHYRNVQFNKYAAILFVAIYAKVVSVWI